MSFALLYGPNKGVSRYSLSVKTGEVSLSEKFALWTLVLEVCVQTAALKFDVC
ncbi:hypothetical protein V3C99_010022 [Haemonchus contortus]|uniref:Uncharacterized protein n=1 Tax=Haemonchus contortus TaxID=6289 RepID=A0A7I4YJD2_HAECO